MQHTDVAVLTAVLQQLVGQQQQQPQPQRGPGPYGPPHPMGGHYDDGLGPRGFQQGGPGMYPPHNPMRRFNQYPDFPPDFNPRGGGPRGHFGPMAHNPMKRAEPMGGMGTGQHPSMKRPEPMHGLPHDAGGAKRQRVTQAGRTFPDAGVKELRVLLSDIVRPTAELAVTEGLKELDPEKHGYPLSRIKEDMRGRFSRDMDYKQMGGGKLSDVITLHAADLVTMFTHPKRGVLLLPILGKDYGKAPPELVKAAAEKAEKEAKMKELNGEKAEKADPAAPSEDKKPSAEKKDGDAAPKDAAMVAAKQIKFIAKLLKRKLVANRFWLYQDALRDLVKAPSSSSKTDAAKSGLHLSSSREFLGVDGTLMAHSRAEKLEALAEAAARIAPKYAFTLSSFIDEVKAICPSSTSLSFDPEFVKFVDSSKLLSAIKTMAKEDPSNPFDLVPCSSIPGLESMQNSVASTAVPKKADEDHEMADEEDVKTEATDGAAENGTEPLAILPQLGDTMNLELVCGMYQLVHKVLTPFDEKRIKALTAARKTAEVAAVKAGYPAGKLREDYRKEYSGQAMHVADVSFGNLIEALQWEVFQPILDIRNTEQKGEKGTVFPKFDTLLNMRNTLEALMTSSIEEEMSGTGPAVEEIRLPFFSLLFKYKFWNTHMYDLSPSLLGFNTMQQMLEACPDLCKLVRENGDSGPWTVVPTPLMKLRLVVRKVLATAAADAAEHMLEAGGDAPDQPSLTVEQVEHEYYSTYSASFVAADCGHTTMAGALGAMSDACSVADSGMVTPPKADAPESSIFSEVRIRAVAPSVSMTTAQAGKAAAKAPVKAAGPLMQRKGGPSAPLMRQGMPRDGPMGGMPRDGSMKGYGSPYGMKPPMGGPSSMGGQGPMRHMGSLGPIERPPRQRPQEPPRQNAPGQSFDPVMNMMLKDMISNAPADAPSGNPLGALAGMLMGQMGGPGGSKHHAPPHSQHQYMAHAQQPHAAPAGAYDPMLAAYPAMPQQPQLSHYAPQTSQQPVSQSHMAAPSLPPYTPQQQQSVWGVNTAPNAPAASYGSQKPAATQQAAPQQRQQHMMQAQQPSMAPRQQQQRPTPIAAAPRAEAKPMQQQQHSATAVSGYGLGMQNQWQQQQNASGVPVAPLSATAQLPAAGSATGGRYGMPTQTNYGAQPSYPTSSQPPQQQSYTAFPSTYATTTGAQPAYGSGSSAFASGAPLTAVAAAPAAYSQQQRAAAAVTPSATTTTGYGMTFPSSTTAATGYGAPAAAAAYTPAATTTYTASTATDATAAAWQAYYAKQAQQAQPQQQQQSQSQWSGYYTQ